MESFARSGEEVLLLCCKLADTGRIIGFGCCTVNTHQVRGRETRLGYLTGLRLLKEYRNNPSILIDAYSEMMTWIERQEIDIVYSTVLEDNVIVQKMFEKRRNFFPYYVPIGHYNVYCSTTRLGKVKTMKDYDLYRAAEGDIDDILAFIKDYGASHDLYPAVRKRDLLGESVEKLHYSNYFIAREVDGGAVCAVCYAWYQNDYKQHILHRYKGRYRFLKHLRRLLPFFGYPLLPDEGTVLDYYTLAFYGYKEGREEAFESLVRFVAGLNRKSNYWLIGIAEGDPLNRVLQKLSRITYRSKIYAIDYRKTKKSGDMIKDLSNLYIECGRL